MKLGERQRQQVGANVFNAWDSLYHAAIIPHSAQQRKRGLSNGGMRSRLRRAAQRHYPGMSPPDSRQVLWANVSALMVQRWGEENLNRLAREAEIGLGTAARLKKQTTSVGLELVDKLARGLHVEPWQLLVPGASASNPPVLLPVSESERRFYERVKAAAEALKENGQAQ